VPTKLKINVPKYDELKQKQKVPTKVKINFAKYEKKQKERITMKLNFGIKKRLQEANECIASYQSVDVLKSYPEVGNGYLYSIGAQNEERYIVACY
jgi:hypothetical protein